MSYVPAPLDSPRRQASMSASSPRYADSGYAPASSPTSPPPRVDVPYFGPTLRTALSGGRQLPVAQADGDASGYAPEGWRRSPDTYAPHRQESEGTVRANQNLIPSGSYQQSLRSEMPIQQTEWGTPSEASYILDPSSASSHSVPSSYRVYTESTISTASSGSSSGRSFARHQSVTTPSAQSQFSQGEQKKPLEWDTIFHPKFLTDVPNVAQDWHFTGLYTSHILFSQNTKLPPSKKLLIYDVEAQKSQQIKVRYDSAGLGPNGKYLLYRFMDEMSLYDVANSRTIKTASLRNLSRWAYNAIGFCFVDDSGKFWRWNFADKLPPGLIFRLVDRAPRDRLRCLTTADGAWNAVIAANRDRTQGEIHCYPSNNDESRIFSGVLAAFTQSDVAGETVTHITVVKIESEDELSFTIYQLGALVPGVVHRVQTRMPFEAVGGPPSAIFIDHELQVAVILATPPGETYHALLFDLRSGTFLMKQSIKKYPEDSWLVDDTGIFRERSGSIVQRLHILPGGLPPRRTPSSPPPPVNNAPQRTGFYAVGAGQM